MIREAVKVRELTLEAVDPHGIDPRTALEILESPPETVFSLLPLTNALREKYHGNRIKLCSIVNAKSGHCPEVCNFCPQSGHFKETGIRAYPMMEPDEIFAAASDAASNGSSEFSIVTSGRGMGPGRDLDRVETAVQMMASGPAVEKCASLGFVEKRDLARLQRAGLTNYHHNLETARSFFPNIVRSHAWDEETAVVRHAKELGLTVCSGGIFGMGESLEQRVEFIFQVKDLGADKFPINFLNPRPGTPLEGVCDLTPLDCLKIIAVSRLALPDKDIFVLGGREVNLRYLQSWVFMAGANGTMVGNYLTTTGQNPRETVWMIRDLGLELAGEWSDRSFQEGSEHELFPTGTEEA